MAGVNIQTKSFKIIWLIMVLDSAPFIQVIPNKIGSQKENIVTLLTLGSHFLPILMTSNYLVDAFQTALYLINHLPTRVL